MPQDPCLPKRRSGQRIQQGFRPAVNPLQDLAGFAVAFAGQQLLQECHCHVPPSHRAFDHHE